jgi:hypothetical protein
VPVAAPPILTAPAANNTDSEDETDTESILDTRTGIESTLPDPGNAAAWAQSIRTESTPVAQYDALHTLLGESSDGEGLSGTAPMGPAVDSSVSGDESDGNGVSGVVQEVTEEKDDSEDDGESGSDESGDE